MERRLGEYRGFKSSSDRPWIALVNRIYNTVRILSLSKLVDAVAGSTHSLFRGDKLLCRIPLPEDQPAVEPEQLLPLPATPF